MHNQQDSKTAPVKSEQKVPCEVYSRIVGYLRPTRNWNEGKQEEFKERQTFQLDIGNKK
ncbi:MAG TPA: hypothetical protein G4N98_03975 [Thermoflexia bacterium]|nr:hypothetical protein [Thermoflexia bacterium]